MVVVALAAGVTAAFFTNPDAGQHRRAVREAAAEEHGTLGAVLGAAGAELLTYKNHLVFSETRHPVNEQRATLGFFGLVFVNEEALSLKKAGGG